MSLEDNYPGKEKVIESDNAMEEDVQSQISWFPATPAKPQNVFVRRQLLNSSRASSAVSLSSSLDENKGVCDVSVALTTKGEEHNSNGMERTDFGFLGMIDLNKSACACEEVMENTSECAGGAAKGLDFLHSRESNKDPDAWDVPLANILSTDILTLLNVAPASQSSEHAVMEPVIESISNSFVLVSQSESERQAEAEEPATHTSLHVEHDLTPGLSDWNNSNSPETHVLQYDSQPINGSNSTFSCQSEKQNVNESLQNGIDLKKRPRQRSKKKKYWPKVVCEGKPKRTPKPKMPEPTTPKCTSSETNMSKKRKYVRKSSLKNSVTPSDVMANTSEDVVGEGTPKPMTPEPATPKRAMVTTSVDVVAKKDKPKRTPKLKAPKPETPEHASSEKTVLKRRKYVRKSKASNLVVTSDKVIGEKNYSVIKTCKRALSFDLENQSQDDSAMARATSHLQPQNSCRLSSSFDLENHAEEENISLLASQHKLQNYSGKIESAAPVHENRNHRELVTAEAEKPVSECCNQGTNHTGCQHNGMYVYKRKFRVNKCYINSRKLGPVFPKMWKKRRTRQGQRRKIYSDFWSEIPAKFIIQMQSMTAMNHTSFNTKDTLCQPKVKMTKRRSNTHFRRHSFDDLIIRPYIIVTKERSKGLTQRRRNLSNLSAFHVYNYTQLSTHKILGSDRQEQEIEISREPETCNDVFVNSEFHDAKPEGSLANDALLFGDNHEGTVAEMCTGDSSEFHYSKSGGSLTGDALFDSNLERTVTWTERGPSFVGNAMWTEMEPSFVNLCCHNESSANPREHEDFRLNSKSRNTQEKSIKSLIENFVLVGNGRTHLLEQDQNAYGPNNGPQTLIPFEEQEKIAQNPNRRHSTLSTRDAYDQERSVMAMHLEMGPFPVNLGFNINKSEKSPLEHEHFLLPTKSKVDAALQEERSDAHVSEPKCISSDGQAIILMQEQRAHSPNSRHNTLVPYQEQDRNAHDPTNIHGTLVPYQGPFEPTKKRQQLVKVDLDPETMRVWKQLMDSSSSDGETKADEEREKWWNEERNVFRGRVDAFVSRMRQIQGDRRFKPWKGSVVDSVVGVFLTQNVSDHLSSSAYISLASKFPSSDQKASNENLLKVDSIEYVVPAFDSEGNELFVSKTELDMSYGLDNGAKFLAARADGANLEGTQDKGPVKDADEPCKSEDSFRVQTTDGSQLSYSCRSIPDLGTIYTPFSMGSFKDFSEPLQSEKTTLLQKSCSNKSNILSSNENTENEYTEPRGMDDEIRNLCDRINDLALNQGANASEISFFPLDVEVDHLKILEDCKTGSVNHMSKNLTLMEDSCPEVVVQQKMPSKTQEAAEVVSCTFDKPFLPPGCNSQGDCGIEKGPHTKNCHEGGRTNFQTEKTAANELESLVDEMVGKMQPTSDANSLNKKRRKGKNTNSKEKSSSGMAFEETKKTTRRVKNKKVEKEEEINWDELRRTYSTTEPRSSNHMDSVDWEAVRCAENSEIATAIKDRGQQNIIAGRIKDFLNRVVTLHKSIDLEWLRNVPPDLAKKYLLEVNGLGLKSVECVRLLALQNIAFPVDTNVGRIAVRLGWVPLQPLPEELQIHLLEQYPLMDTIQKYLWPRLCNLDQPTLYELHYQLITFGKVFCTKRKPNCIACPMKGECKHFASAFASARRALPAPAEKSIVTSMIPSTAENCNPVTNPTSLLLEPNQLQASENQTKNSEPIIEEPASPEPESTPIIEEPTSPEPEYIELTERDIEDFSQDDPDEILTINLSGKEFTAHQNLDENTMSRALVALTAEAAFIRMPKLKNVSRLRTEHQVYVIPDFHPLLKGLDRRVNDDPCPYLLAIWTPGETANSFEPPKKRCNSQDGELCNEKTCFSCNSIREQNSNTIRGTILIPCQTAMRGSFPLNGTYFQVNEVFADDESSQNPINVPRELIWHLERRTAYFATSATTILRGLSIDEIRTCFIRGFICVRGFDRKTRAPRPLAKRFHRSTSMMGKSKTEE